MSDDDNALRADARANRNHLLEVAREALATDPAASLNSIAKAAGVGTGTLYRHFPSREALVLGVYRQEIEALVALAPSLLAKHPPLSAFRRWCERIAEFGRIKHGVASVLHAVISEQDLQETYGTMLAAVRQLLGACEAASAVRPGTDPEDVLVLLGLLWQIPPDPAGIARAERLLALVFRGLGGENTGARECFVS